VKQLAISSRSGLDHSAQNLVTTSSGEFIMPRKNAPAQTDISSPRPDPGVPRGDRQTPKTQLAKRWSAHRVLPLSRQGRRRRRGLAPPQDAGAVDARTAFVTARQQF
jgi:hypothetical protein